MKEGGKFMEDVIKKANILEELPNMVKGIWGESIWKELLDLIIEKQRQTLQAEDSKRSIREYIAEKYKEG